MELTIRSLKGSCVLNVEETATVARLKELLHEQQHDLAPPEQQRLVSTQQQCIGPWLERLHAFEDADTSLCCTQVHKQAQLPNEAQLQQAGIRSGDQLVLLEAKPLVKPQAARISPVGCQPFHHQRSQQLGS